MVRNWNLLCSGRNTGTTRGCLVEKVFTSEEVLTEFQLVQLSETEAPEISRIEEDFITALLDRFVMNVTALNNYLKCPLEFYFKNLLRIPSPKNEATEFGSAIHHALQRLFEKMRENNNRFPAKGEFIDDFNWYMHRHRENFYPRTVRPPFGIWAVKYSQTITTITFIAGTA